MKARKRRVWAARFHPGRFAAHPLSVGEIKKKSASILRQPGFLTRPLRSPGAAHAAPFGAVKTPHDAQKGVWELISRGQTLLVP